MRQERRGDSWKRVEKKVFGREELGKKGRERERPGVESRPR
jgi:hypothetical protein